MEERGAPVVHIPCSQYWCGPLRKRLDGTTPGLFHDEKRSVTSSTMESEVGEEGEEMDFAFNNAVAEDYLAQNLSKFQTRVDEGKIGRIPLEEGDSGFLSATERRYRIDKSASHLTSSGFLNPKCLRDLRGCNNSTRLGEILGLIITEDIQSRIDAAVNHPDVLSSLSALDAVPDDAEESEVESAFDFFVRLLIKALKSTCQFGGRRINFCVGGILADESCAVSGVTDYVALNEKGEIAFATECKTMYAHPLEELFYEGSKGYQLFGAFFGSGCKPTFLYTQKHFILLVWDQSSSRTFKYPPGNDKFMVDCLNLIEAIAICLLSSSKEIREDVPLRPLRRCDPLNPKELSPTEISKEKRGTGRKRKGKRKGGDEGGLKLTAENLIRLGESLNKYEFKI